MTVRFALIAAAGVSAMGAVTPSAHADIDRLPGGYRAEAGAQVCRLRLDAPARAPEDSGVVAETLTGLVLALPGCPAGLSDAMLWRAPADASTLSLVDGAGGVLAEFEPAGGGRWTRPGDEGPTLILQKN